MKICLVSQEYPPERGGGIATQTLTKAEGLARRGHHVFVLTRSKTGSVTKSGNLTVIRLPAFLPGAPIYTEVADWASYSGRVAATLDELHAREKLDLVEFPEWACEGYSFLLNRGESNRVPAVIQLHGPLVMFAHTMGWPELDSEFYRTGTAMEATCLRLADAIYSSSECSIDWCARHYGIPGNEVPVMHTGVDTSQFYPRQVPKRTRPTVIFVGKITRNKGIFELLEAASLLANEFPRLRLQIIGGGEKQLVEALQSRASEIAPEGLLDISGFVKHAELPEHLCRAHVFAAPSMYEGGPGFVYLEAMACGLPVIACQGSGPSEVITHGETGFLVPPQDSAALADVLRRLLHNPGERDRLGTVARNYVMAQCDQEVCLSRLESFYQSVAGKASVSDRARRQPAETVTR